MASYYDFDSYVTQLSNVLTLIRDSQPERVQQALDSFAKPFESKEKPYNHEYFQCNDDSAKAAFHVLKLIHGCYGGLVIAAAVSAKSKLKP